MSEKSLEALRKYKAPPFTAGSARTREAARVGQAKGVRTRKEKKLIREDLEKVLAGKFNMEVEKERLKALGFNPKTVQEALIMSAVIKDIQNGNSRVLLHYAQLLGEIDIQTDSMTKVDAILEEIDNRAEEPQGENDDGDA